MRVLITGANGFIGTNAALALSEREGWQISRFVRGDNSDSLAALVENADAVLHLAGENRPADPADFETGNVALTRALCAAVAKTGRNIPIVAASSAQAVMDNDYGRSKLAGEKILENYANQSGNRVTVFRLPGVFGKWCRPDYNSVVATFCHNIAHAMPISISNPDHLLHLVYVDDVIKCMANALQNGDQGYAMENVNPVYNVTLGALARQIGDFEHCRSSLISEDVGTGFTHALYATYVSYLPVEKFSYAVPRHGDERGVFVEMLKTKTAGQFSFFTAHPGITRGGHYHHSKTEKFLVIKGQALFKFRHMISGERYEMETDGSKSEIVDTVPGWTHDITNIGTDEMIVMLWANEIFDPENPDTYSSKV